MTKRYWTEEELLIALKIYCELAFGQFNSSNPRIIKVSNIINRTPSALSMKLCNFASLDPAMEGKGLKSVSKSDKKIMSDFLESPETMIFKSELAYSNLDLGRDYTSLQEPEAVAFECDYENMPKTEKQSMVKTRILQSFFRKTVISSYNFSCAVCSINIPEMLIASHIIPWAEDEKLRIIPTNGIALCALHDKAFDRGFFSLKNDYSIIISPQINNYKDNNFVDIIFLQFSKQTLHMPFRFMPDTDCITWHRENVFRN